MSDNQFIAEVSLSFPHGPDGQRIEQWLNVQHVGKSQIPLDEEVSEELQQAHHKLHMCRRANVMVEVDANGEWKFLEIK